MMYSTLIELERIHGCPMVVRDAFTHSWYLVLGLDEESSGGFIYRAKLLEPNQYRPKPGVGVNLIYGGYSKWVYIAKPESTQNEGEISPEEQKRIKEAERKRNNDRITRDLRREHKVKRESEQRKTMNKLKGHSQNKVIPFRGRPKQ